MNDAEKQEPGARRKERIKAVLSLIFLASGF
jgi:hypothetical protein